MKEVLYIEIPTPDTAAVKLWLQNAFEPAMGEKSTTPSGIKIWASSTTPQATRISEPAIRKTLAELPTGITSGIALPDELSIFVWSVQRTTYLKAFRWGNPLPGEQDALRYLIKSIQEQFPNHYPAPPKLIWLNNRFSQRWRVTIP